MLCCRCSTMEVMYGKGPHHLPQQLLPSRCSNSSSNCHNSHPWWLSLSNSLSPSTTTRSTTTRTWGTGMLIPMPTTTTTRKLTTGPTTTITIIMIRGKVKIACITPARAVDALSWCTGEGPLLPLPLYWCCVDADSQLLSLMDGDWGADLLHLSVSLQCHFSCASGWVLVK